MKLRTGSAPCWQAICFLGFFVFFSLSTGIKAQDSASEIPRSFGMDAPFIAASTQPGWLQFPASVPSTFAHLTFEISPPADFQDSALLLTVYFQDQPSGFLRVYSQVETQDRSQTLSDNLFEGVYGTNQRTLLLSDLHPGQSVLVTFQSGSAVLPVRRLVWSWVHPQAILVDPTRPQPAAVQGDTVLHDRDLSGSPVPGPSSEVADGYVNVPMQDQPEQINSGINFVVTLDRQPSHVRLAAEILSAAVEGRLLCRINGQAVPDLTPSVPSFRDPSFFWSIAQTGFAGWLPSTLYLPGKLWKTGDNLVEVVPSDFEGHTSNPVVSMKNASLELLFDQTPTPTAAVPPTDATNPPPTP